MRYLMFAALALAVLCSCSDAVSEDGRVRELIDAAVTFYRTGATYYDPLRIEETINKTIDFHHIINGLVTVNNNTFYGIQNVVVDKESADPTNLKGQLVLRFPNITFESDYEVDGKLIGRKASGKGRLLYSILNLTVALSSLEFTEYDKYGTGSLSVEIKSLGLKFDIQNVEFHVIGLKVHGMAMHLFEKAFAEETKLLFKLMKFPLHLALEPRVIEYANTFIAGRSLEELTIWLRDNQYYCEKHGC